MPNASSNALRAAIRQALTDDPQLVERVQDMYTLLAVRVSYWRGRHKARGAEVVYKDRPVEKGAATDPNWKLLPPEWASRFSALDIQASELVRIYSTRARLCDPTRTAHGNDDDDEDAQPNTVGDTGLDSLRGIHLVLAARLEEFVSRLDDVGDLLRAAGEEFSGPRGQADLDDHLARLFPDVTDRAAVRESVPSPEELKRRFGVRRGMLPIGLPASAACGDSFKTRMALDTVRSQAEANLETAIRAPREQLAAACRTLREQLADYRGLKYRRSLRGASLSRFRKELKAFDSFASLAEQELHEARHRVEFALASVPGNTDSEAAREFNRDDQAAREAALALGVLADTASSEEGMLEAVRQVLASRSSGKEAA